MAKICKYCKRNISNKYGICPKCFNALPKKRQKEIEEHYDEKISKKGKNTLEKY